MAQWAAVTGLLLLFALPSVYLAQRRYVSRVAEARSVWDARLQVIAEGRAELIAAWVRDAVNDAHVVASFPSVVELLALHAQGPSHPLPDTHPTRRHLDVLLESFARLKGHKATYVADSSGRIAAGANEPLVADVSQHLQLRHGGRPPGAVEVMVVRGTVLVVAAVVVPLPDKPGLAAGFVGVVADPHSRLFSELLREPVLAGVGEVVLASREAGQLVYVSPRPGPPPNDSQYFVPVPPRLLRAAGEPGRDEADDRGVPILIASRPVGGTPWLVMAQVRRDHALGPAEQRGVRDVVSQALAVVAIAATVLAAWSFRRARHAAESLAAARRIGFLNRLLRTTLAVNELIARERDRQRLLDGSCAILVERAGFVMASVGVRDSAGSLTPVAVAGRVEGYFDELRMRLDEASLRKGPTGTAIQERRVVVVADLAASPLDLPWRAAALERGYRGAAAFPLVHGDRVFGAISVYSPDPGQLLDEEVSLLGELATDLGFALHVLEREAAHRATEDALAESEARLRQAQKMEAIGRLAGGVAHDFNNLLTAISGYAELALDEDDERERQRSVQEVLAASKRAAALTRQLLAFSRKQVLQLQVLSLDDVVREVRDLLRRLVGENVELVTRLASADARVRADAGQLQQVIVNLAVNARDAMPRGGRLVISTSSAPMPPVDPGLGDLPAGPGVLLEVSDSGDGMTPDVLQHLFEPFFTTKEPGKGTGLGLSTVYGIVKQFGGVISVESTAGQGTTFRVSLPAVGEEMKTSEVVVAAEPAQAGAAVHREATVLVAEDDEGVRAFVTEALRRAGYRVLEAESAERAAALLLELDADADLLLTDVVLPKADGHQLARRLQADRPGMKVLFMSGYADTPHEDAGHDGTDHIEKPFSAATLVDRVRAALTSGTA